MDKGYIENGFIVDLSNAGRTSEIIYELSRILDIPEAKNKQICIKLGDLPLNKAELISIKALVETMASEIKFISTISPETTKAAKELGINVSEIQNSIDEPDFEEQKTPNPEVEHALNRIFGNENFDDEENSEITEIKKISFEVEDDDEETKLLRVEAEKLPTSYIKRTIRSGQSLSSDGNLFVIGDVNPGAEIIAKGDITVWGILGGIAHAGNEGNSQARIRALKMNAIQLKIADVFARRPDGSNTPYIQKTNEFEPEEARVYKKHIIINKLIEEN